MTNVASLLERIDQGSERSADELVRILYHELRRLARNQLARESPGQSFQTTDLVHEAYLRLLCSDQQWHGTSHFFVAAAEAMRRILVERARQKRCIKYGRGFARVALSEAVAHTGPSAEEVIMVSDLLESLAMAHPLGAQIVRLHYFAGLSIREAGRVLGISSSVANRRWIFARAWLREAIQKEADERREVDDRLCKNQTRPKT